MSLDGTQIMCVWFLCSRRQMCHADVRQHVRLNPSSWQKCDLPQKRIFFYCLNICLLCPCLVFFFFFFTASWGNVMIHSRRHLTSGLINQFSSTVGILGKRLRSHCILRLVPPSVRNHAPLQLFAACSLSCAAHESHAHFNSAFPEKNFFFLFKRKHMVGLRCEQWRCVGKERTKAMSQT